MSAITTIQDYAYFQASNPTNGIFSLKKDLSSTGTSMTVNFALVDETDATPTLNFFIALTNSDNVTEVMRVTSVSGTTLTVVRGMARGGIDFAGAAGNAVEHKAGQVIKLIPYAGVIQMLADGLLGNISVSIKLASNPTYDAGISIAPNTYADVATRNAAIPSPADWVFAGVDDTGMTYYNPTTVQWETLGSETPTPNASTTVAGKVEIATTAQAQAGTDTGETGALLSVLPSDIATNVQNSVYSYAVDAEASDAYAITLTPAITAYAEGQKFIFKANTANTGASTLNVNGLGAKNIYKAGGTTETNDIASGSIVEVVYDGTKFQMTSQLATAMSTANSATLTDGSDASALHIHTIKVGLLQRTLNAGAGAVTTAHGLGIAPRMIRFTYSLDQSAIAGINQFNGHWISGTNQTIGIIPASDTLSQDITNQAISIATSTNNGATATVTAVDATNFTLTWADVGTPAGSVLNILGKLTHKHKFA